MSKTFKVAKTSDLSPGTGKVVQADGRDVALFNVDGSFFAIDNACPHRGGPLGNGKLTGDTVECPWHHSHFNVKTGAVTRPPATTGVACFPVKVEGEDIIVEID